MEIVYERCAGLDVHKKNVKACFTGPGPGGRGTKETRTYLTMTEDLVQLRDWVKEQGCTHIALEATGVYTPPPMLPSGGGPIKRGRRREWTDAKNHADLLLIDLHPFDERPDNVPTRLKISLVELLVDFRCKGFQASHNDPERFFPLRFLFETVELFLKMLETFTHTCHSRFKFLPVNESLSVAINQPCDPSAEFAHLRI